MAELGRMRSILGCHDGLPDSLGCPLPHGATGSLPATHRAPLARPGREPVLRNPLEIAVRIGTPKQAQGKPRAWRLDP